MEEKRKKDFQRLYNLAGKKAAEKLEKNKSKPGFMMEGTEDRIRAGYQKDIYNKKANKYEKKNKMYSAPGEGPRYSVRNDKLEGSESSKDSKNKVARNMAERKMSKTAKAGKAWDKAESTKGFVPLPFLSKVGKAGKKAAPKKKSIIPRSPTN